jgi:cell division protein FtsW
MTTATKPTQKRPAVLRHMSFRESIDLPLAVIVLTLFAIGLLMIYSASWQFAINQGFSEYQVVLRQALIGMAGIVGIVILTYIDYHSYQKYVVWGMGVVILLCVSVLAFGTETQFGARRGLFGGSVQPSEFAKLGVIVYLSFWLQSKKETLHRWSYGFFPLLFIIGIIALLIFFQPDISAAATIVLLGGIMFFIAGGKFSQILIVLLAVALVGIIIFNISDTASTRVTDYWNGLQNPANASDHVKWSLEAIINGGIFGVGIGRSTTKFIGLPVATTDSIFSVIVEETGLLGGFVVIGLFVALLWRGLHIAGQAQDDLGKWLAGGISLWIFVEAIINIGVLLNLLPFAGNALPLISSGGSSLITILAAVGILMSISRHSKIASYNAERSPKRAVVDMRRRDRRGSIPSAGSPSSGR